MQVFIEEGAKTSLLHSGLSFLECELSNIYELAWFHMRTWEQTSPYFSHTSHGFVRPLLNLDSKASVSLSRIFHSLENPARIRRLGWLHLTWRSLAHSANSLAR